MSVCRGFQCLYTVIASKKVLSVCINRHFHVSHLLHLRGTNAKISEETHAMSNQQLVSESDAQKILGPANPYELSDIGRNLSPSYNFAAYVNQSPTLQRLVQLGVNLSKLEKTTNVAEFVLRLDFEKHIGPYVQFLLDQGVRIEDMGYILTKNILLCRESIENLKIRINYLEAKKFSKENISAIITKNPKWLTTPVSVIDGRLGWLQINYKLTGDEIRALVNDQPQIVTFDLNNFKVNHFVFEYEMGLTPSRIKSILLKKTRLFMKDQKKLIASFEYVHNTMKIPLDRICAQPDILMYRLQVLKERHLFLESLGRAQYNPRLPGYISLDYLIKCDDVTFVTDVAKSNTETFNLFLKTL